MSAPMADGIRPTVKVVLPVRKGLSRALRPGSLCMTPPNQHMMSPELREEALKSQKDHSQFEAIYVLHFLQPHPVA